MKYSLEVMHKPVISADRNEKMGRVNGFIIDPDAHKLAAFVLEPEPKQNTFMVIPYASVQSIYNDAVIVENLPEPLRLDQTPRLMELFVRDAGLVGAKCITETGMLAGAIKDFAFELRTGELTRLRIAPEAGYPESFDISKVIKITPERIIVSRELSEAAAAAITAEPPAAPAPVNPAAHEPDLNAPVPITELAAAQTAAAVEAMSADEDERNPSRTPRVDAARIQLLIQELRSDLRAELEELYSTMFRDELREGMRETANLLLERINTLDTAKRFEEFRGQLIDEIKVVFSIEPEEKPDAPALELVLEEKLKQTLGVRMDAMTERLGALEKQSSGAAAENKSLNDTIKNLADKLPGQVAGSLREQAESMAAGAQSALDSVRDAVAGIAAPMCENIERLGGRIDALAASVSERALPDEKIDLAVEELKSDLHDLFAQSADHFESGFTAALDGVKEKIESLAAGVQGALSVELDARREALAEQWRGELEPLRELMQTLGEQPQEASRKIGERLDALVAGMEARVSSLSENMDAALAQSRESLQTQFEGLRALVESFGEQPEQSAQRLIERLDEIMGKVEGSMAAASDRLSAAIADTTEPIAAQLKKELEPIREKLDAQPDLQAFTDLAVDRMDDALAALRNDFTGGAEGRSGIFMQQLDRIDAAVGNRLEKVLESQNETRELTRKIGDALESRFTGIRSALEDMLREEFSRHAEATLEKTGHMRDDLHKIADTFEAMGGMPAREDLDALKEELLNEVRAFSDGAIRNEDIVALREWFESAVAGIVNVVGKEAEEKMGRALAAMKHFQQDSEENAAAVRTGLGGLEQKMITALDRAFESWERDMREHVAAGVAPVAEKLQEKLSQRFDALQSGMAGAGPADEIRALLAEIADTSRRATEATRSELDTFRAGMGDIVEAMRAAGEMLVDQPGGADVKAQEAFLNERLQRVAARLEKRLHESAAETIETIEQRLEARDGSIEAALRQLAAAIDKLSRGGGLGDVLGNRLLNIFGGGQPAPERSDPNLRIGNIKTHAGTPRRSGPATPVDAAQVRRLAYLIGKTVTRSIEDREGGLIAAQGDVVDETIIHAARDAHRVLDLIRAVDLSND